MLSKSKAFLLTLVVSSAGWSYGVAGANQPSCGVHVCPPHPVTWVGGIHVTPKGKPPCTKRPPQHC